MEHGKILCFVVVIILKKKVCQLHDLCPMVGYVHGLLSIVHDILQILDQV